MSRNFRLDTTKNLKLTRLEVVLNNFLLAIFLACLVWLIMLMSPFCWPWLLGGVALSLWTDITMKRFAKRDLLGKAGVIASGVLVGWLMFGVSQPDHP